VTDLALLLISLVWLPVMVSVAVLVVLRPSTESKHAVSTVSTDLVKEMDYEDA